MRFHHLHAADVRHGWSKVWVHSPHVGSRRGAEEEALPAAALGRNAACNWWRKLIGEIAKGGQSGCGKVGGQRRGHGDRVVCRGPPMGLIIDGAGCRT
jgi:hypothetical protein